MVRLALAWVLTRPQVTSVLIGARSVEQVEQAFDAESLEWSDERFKVLAADA